MLTYILNRKSMLQNFSRQSKVRDILNTSVSISLHLIYEISRNVMSTRNVLQSYNIGELNLNYNWKIGWSERAKKVDFSKQFSKWCPSSLSVVCIILENYKLVCHVCCRLAIQNFHKSATDYMVFQNSVPIKSTILVIFCTSLIFVNGYLGSRFWFCVFCRRNVHGLDCRCGVI